MRRIYLLAARRAACGWIESECLIYTTITATVSPWECRHWCTPSMVNAPQSVYRAVASLRTWSSRSSINYTNAACCAVRVIPEIYIQNACIFQPGYSYSGSWPLLFVFHGLLSIGVLLHFLSAACTSAFGALRQTLPSLSALRLLSAHQCPLDAPHLCYSSGSGKGELWQVTQRSSSAYPLFSSSPSMHCAPLQNILFRSTSVFTEVG